MAFLNAPLLRIINRNNFMRKTIYVSARRYPALHQLLIEMDRADAEKGQYGTANRWLLEAAVEKMKGPVDLAEILRQVLHEELRTHHRSKQAADDVIMYD